MAHRPIFVPLFEGDCLYEEKDIEFHWHPGFAVSQKRKCINELHQSARNLLGHGPILEISTKSPIGIGVSLSAFNLEVTIGPGEKSYVENVFQASKVFANGGPFEDLLHVPPFKAKTDPRLRNSGKLVKFQHRNIEWLTNEKPLSLFYDWIYIKALLKFPERINLIRGYRAFTDIEYNSKKSINCQARSVSILASILERNLDDRILKSFRAFKYEMIWRHARYQQLDLFEEK